MQPKPKCLTLQILLASTALVAATGAAQAQGVSLSGSAEMGIVGGDRVGPDAFEGVDTDEINFFADVDVRFTMSGETDGGLRFGVSVDLDEADNLGDEADNGGYAVFISGGFGTVTLGDTDGALDRVMIDAATAGNPGSIIDDETEHAGYVGAFGDGAFDNQVLNYSIETGRVLWSVSYEQGAGLNGVYENTDPHGSIGGGALLSFPDASDFPKFTPVESMQIALGFLQTEFATGDDQLIIGASFGIDFTGGISAALGYTDWQNVGGVSGLDDSHFYLGVGYDFDRLSLHANYGEFDSGDSGFGFAAGYDLGGGASILFGYGSSDRAGSASDNDTYSLGLQTNF
ncbi:MAG: porin [Pseudomonadota bacterium]